MVSSRDRPGRSGNTKAQRLLQDGGYHSRSLKATLRECIKRDYSFDLIVRHVKLFYKKNSDRSLSRREIKHEEFEWLC